MNLVFLLEFMTEKILQMMINISEVRLIILSKDLTIAKHMYVGRLENEFKKFWFKSINI